VTSNLTIFSTLRYRVLYTSVLNKMAHFNTCCQDSDVQQQDFEFQDQDS